MSDEAPVIFDCDGESLVGIVHLPAARRGLGVVIVVGGPQYRVGSHRQFVQMARAFAIAGYPVLRFDYRGMGDSEGTVHTFDNVDADIHSAVDALLAAAPDVRAVVLWGLCDAASAALMYCCRDSRVRGVVLANPWVRTAAGEARTYLRHYYLHRLLEPAFWHKVLTGAFNPLRSIRELGRAVRSASASAGPEAQAPFLGRMLRGLRGFERPVLVLLSERDLTAQEFADLVERERGWRRAMRRPNVVVTRLPNADHTFSTRAALELVNRASLTWLDQVLKSY